MNAIAKNLPPTLKRPDLVELLDSLAKYGTKDQRARARKAKTNAAKLEAVAELAGQARKRRRIHALSLGWAACQVEAGHEDPTLLELLITPTTATGEVTCAKCRKAIGLDDIDLVAQAEEDAEVEAAKAQAEKRAARAEKAAARAEAKAQAEAAGDAQAVEAQEPKAARSETAELDDLRGTDLRDPAATLAIVFFYKGENHRARLLHSGQVETADGTIHASPSAAGGAVTGGAVNGWRRWRYVARDGLTYAIARMRGQELAPVRVGKTGRRPSRAAAIARHREALARAEKAAARLAKALALVAELEAKDAQARDQVASSACAAKELGADIDGDGDLFPAEKDEAAA